MASISLILSHAGYDQISYVSKKRVNYINDEYRDIYISFDEVGGLEDYLEVEVLVGSHKMVEQAKVNIYDVAQSLSFSLGDAETKPYDKLLSQNKEFISKVYC